MMNNTQATPPSTWYEIQNHSLTLSTGLGQKEALRAQSLPFAILNFKFWSTKQLGMVALGGSKAAEDTRVQRSDTRPLGSCPLWSTRTLHIHGRAWEKPNTHSRRSNHTGTYICNGKQHKDSKISRILPIFSELGHPKRQAAQRRMYGLRTSRHSSRTTITDGIADKNKDTAVSGGGFKPHRTASHMAGGFVVSTERLWGLLMAAEKAKKGHPSWSVVPSHHDSTQHSDLSLK